jgi:hypothetical protein
VGAHLGWATDSLAIGEPKTSTPNTAIASHFVPILGIEITPVSFCQRPKAKSRQTVSLSPLLLYIAKANPDPIKIIKPYAILDCLH